MAPWVNPDSIAAIAPPWRLDLVDQGPRAGLQLGGQRLDQVTPAQRIGDGGHVGLVRDDLLCSNRQGRRRLRREAKRLVEGVRV